MLALSSDIAEPPKEIPIEMLTICLPLSEWNRRRSMNRSRFEALQRLYARKDALDQLIRALEEYRKLTPMRQGECIPMVAAEKCS